MINQKVSLRILQWRATAEERENEPKEPHKIKKKRGEKEKRADFSYMKLK